MKKPAAGKRTKRPSATARVTRSEEAGRIHPVIIYPFRQRSDYSDLESLYELVARLDRERETYARPITVMDRKTFYTMEGNKPFHDFRKNVVAKHSEIVDAWCVDTCQMWYSGLGLAFERGREGDVYWLIPGDFNYGTPAGKGVLGRLHDLPEIVSELHQDFCIGEIATDHNNSKQLIDTYGTFGLLYNWFPAEAQRIREMTERPRSEFFAIRHSFLREVLRERWFAYEQTVVILLKAVATDKKITRFLVGDISDLPEGRERFASALPQVERTERVLKTLWRQKHESIAGWNDEYRALEMQSGEIRRAALTVLRNLLG
jgi:hypothetical protein